MLRQIQVNRVLLQCLKVQGTYFDWVCVCLTVIENELFYLFFSLFIEMSQNYFAQ